jgi:4-amino-4-deoxy-L-arabinose transferase-like glycosyltransferase
LIPWEHVLAIFQKIMLPEYFSVHGYLLFGNVWVDVGFHLLAIFLVIILVIWVASRIFDREGLIS